MNKKYKRGFVAGMFDVLHGGHIDLLRIAKENCEHLIVAVGTDEFYRVRKGREPFLSYPDRVEIIRAIRYVDEVVEETDLNKVALYKKHHFDAMFAGDDHEFEDVYVQAVKILKEFGVDTIYTPRRGINSTDLQKKFLNGNSNSNINKLPVLINWSLTERCNLNCGFCFRFHDKELPSDKMKIVLEKIVKSGVRRVTLTGGEPTLVNGLESIAEKLRYAGIFVSLHTNGMNVDYVKKNYFHFDRISLSLDGLNSFVNKIMRGHDDYFEKIMDLIMFLKENKRDFAIKTTVTKKNIDSILDMVDFINDIKPTFWSLFEFLPLENGKLNKDDYLLNDGEFNGLISKIKCDVTLNTMSLIEASGYPMFSVAANGEVYTKDGENGKISVGSLLDNETNVEIIWAKIIKKNKIEEKYINRWNIIQNVPRF
ncbi:MAG: radical SAM protein [Fibromonadaceae bacterium]|jgi:glycerol-3-phosphate cytidylyltransferase|nr:radical SAM protein [Fibromonadaceae bacterium]